MNNQVIALSAPNDPQVPQVFDPQRTMLDAEYELIGDRGGIDLRAIRATLWRERKLILAILTLALAAGVLSIILVRPVYQARAAVQVEQQLPNVLGTQDVEPVPAKTEADRFFQTQVDILESRAIAAGVIKALKLDKQPAFLNEVGISTNAETGVPVSDQAINAVQDRLTVTPPRDTRVMGISFNSENPRLAAAVANGFADTFVHANLQRRFDTFAYSRQYLREQIEATKVRLEKSERALIDYARSAGLVDASGAAGATVDDGGRRSLTTANLVDLNAAYAQARTNRLQAQQRWQQAQATPLMSLPEVLANPTVQNLSRQRAEFEATYQEERQRRKEEHPGMQQAAAKIEELDRQIGALAASIRTSIGDQYNVAQRQESALHGAVSQLKSATLTEQDKGVQYNILKREVDAGRDLFNTLLQRYSQISSQAGLTNNNISIVDRANVPISPIYPNPALNMALAGFGGLMLALIVAFTRERLGDAVHTPNQIEQELGLQLLGVVPKLKGPQSLDEALADPRSPIVEAHHTIAMALDTSAMLPKHSILLLTSSGANEGKSTTALILGSNLAATGKRVLLIDGDMRRGSLHRVIGLPNEKGLADVLSKRVPPLEAIQYSDSAGLAFIARGRSRSSPAELLASERMSDFLIEVRGHYDVAIIDGPPVLGLADAPRLAAAADGTLLVMEAHSASKERCKIALRRLVSSGAHVIGLVLTKFDPDKAGGDYGYAYTYEYGAEDEDEAGRGQAIQA